MKLKVNSECISKIQVLLTKTINCLLTLSEELYNYLESNFLHCNDFHCTPHLALAPQIQKKPFLFKGTWRDPNFECTLYACRFAKCFHVGSVLESLP